jgi:quercetin dioxygenase-like cupin family protein
MNQRLCLIAFLAVISSGSFCQVTGQNTLPNGAVQLASEDIQWTDGPAALPAGSKMAVLYGDTKKAGLFAIRLKFPPNAVVKPHRHSEDEVVTIVEGNIAVGFGDQMDQGKAKTFSAKGFYVIPAKTYHFVSIGNNGATIQINSNGPWTVEFK